jgi:beta-lactamase regulating signal transducer with metallopeptidase domain
VPDDALRLFVDVSLRGSAVLAAGWVLTALIRRAPAAVRHFAWMCAIAAAALVPATAMVMPDWAIAVPPLTAMSQTLRPPAAEGLEQSQAPAGPVRATVAPRDSTSPVAPVAAIARLDSATLLLTVWAAGATAVILYLLLGAAAVSRLRRSARPADAAWVDEAQVLAEAFDVPPVAFVESAMTAMPIACGVWRQAIVMPSGAADWPADRRRVAVLHELAHVRRRDCLTQAAAHLVCALYWFNPLAWLAARRLRAERERACDDFVLAAGTKGSEYARHLLDLARAEGTRFPLLAGAGVAMAHRSQLEGRLMAILDPAIRRSSAASARAAALAAITLISIPVAALQPQEPAAVPRDIALTAPATVSAAVARSQDGTVLEEVTISVNPVRELRTSAAREELAAAARALRAAADRQQTPQRGEPAQSPRAPDVGVDVQGWLALVRQSQDSLRVLAAEVQSERSRPERALDRALLEAAEEGDVQGINDLLAAGADVNAPVDGDGSALIVAARRGRLEIVRLLLDRGADPNIGVEGDGSAIIMAASQGHIAVVELLLQRGAHIDQVVDGDENALIQASAAGRLDMVKLLVSRGADVNVRLLVRRATVTQTETEVVDNLGQKRLIPVRRLNTREEWRSALSMARQGGHEAVVAFLISAGAQD